MFSLSPHSVAWSPEVPRTLVPDSYVTDGSRLFRVVARPPSEGPARGATLEDCRSLHVRAYSVTELYALRLRRVQPAG
jgi:hypothetical protein